MHIASGLATTADKGEVMKANLNNFANTIDNFEVIDDSLEFEDWAQMYLHKENTEDTFCFYDCTSILNQYKTWFSVFGNIQTFYAMKCNPSPSMMKLMTSLPGMCVDCASPEEIRICLEAGLPQERLIYANPVKSIDAIKYMRDQRVWCTTLDSVEEIEKMYSVLSTDAENCRIVLRLWVDDSHASCPLGSKFGCQLDEVPAILETLQKYHMTAVGVSFHVGSGNSDPMAFDYAIRDTAACFEMAKTYGFIMNLIDMGGGWPGLVGDSSFKNEFLSAVCTIIRSAIIKYHLDETPDLKIIAEPGRYFNDHSIYLSCAIDSVVKRGDRYVYRLHEGIMGVFKELVLGSLSFITSPVQGSVDASKDLYPSVVLGPTSLKKDIVINSIDLPKLQEGDRLFFKHIGAYTLSESNKPHRSHHKVVHCIRKSSLI